MNSSPRIAAAALLLAAALALPARAARVDIASPDRPTTYPWAQAVDRQIRWSERDHCLLAVVTYHNGAHNDVVAQSGDEELWFRFPGTVLEADQTITVTDAATGEKIVIGKKFPSRAVSLYKNTLVMVTRDGGHVRLSLSVDTERDPEAAAKKKAEKDAPKPVPLDQAR
jgi:hypothetical protein